MRGAPAHPFFAEGREVSTCFRQKAPPPGSPGGAVCSVFCTLARRGCSLRRLPLLLGVLAARFAGDPRRSFGDPLAGLEELFQVVAKQLRLGGNQLLRGSAARQRIQLLQILLGEPTREVEPFTRD